MPTGKVVVLAGGTGGAKLARGMLDVAGEDLVVVANTADDVEIYESYVSPDPDLCTFWLADRIDERGWGLDGDTFAVMDGLRDLGEDVWFNLGDRDLAIALQRARRLREGARLTEALGELGEAFGLRSRVLPMSDAPVRTWVLKGDDWLPFQEFMIRGRGEGPVDGMELRGIEAATPPPEALEAIAAARAIIIGPSNPVISIKPILDVPGIREALAASPAKVVAVSPVVAGDIVKGPTEAFMGWAGFELSATGVAGFYGDVLDGMVSDEREAGDLPVAVLDTLMSDAQSRERVAREALRFAEALAS
ncbi:MAG: 2-phospho-L-lactate transferase [Solirubrobacteraceae bacterium]|nr:2-phospho-L-lactate transferase [Solirubrobacteraceae bacterium]